MKIVLVGRIAAPGTLPTGGVERVNMALAQGLARHVDLDVVSPAHESSGFSDSEGFRAHYLKRGRGPGHLRYWTSDARAIGRKVASLAPDVTHVQAMAGWGRYCDGHKVLTIHGVPARRAALANGERLSLAWRERVKDRLFDRTESASFSRFDRFVIINPFVTVCFPELRCSATTAIPNPLASDFETELVSDKWREDTILAVGALIPRKRQVDVVKLCAPVLKQRPATRLKFFGDTSDVAYVAQVRATASDLGVDTQVEVAGNISAAQLACEMAIAKLMVLLSGNETAPMAITEAHAQGLPIVTVPKFGMRTMIKPDINGLFLESDALGYQHSVIERGLDKAWDHENIARECRAIHSAETIARQTIDLYKELIRGKAAKGQ